MTAIYGITRYGAEAYGESSLAQLRASSFLARPEGYDSIFLSWGNPSGTYDKVTLVRSSFGFPTTPGEGVMLFEDDTATARTSYTDGTPGSESLTPGRFYYYTLFVYISSLGLYQPVGTVLVLLTYDHGTGERMWELLPEVHRTMDAEQYQVDGRGPLYRFLQLFGYQFDQIHTEIDTLLSAYNLDTVSGGVLPVLAASFGIENEPELGQRRTRILLKNAVYLSKAKGTKLGIEGVVSAYTGFGATAITGKNLLFDYNDGGFIESEGRWVLTNGTKLWANFLTYSPAIANTGSVRLTSNGTSPMTLSLGTFAGQSLLPVTAAAQYTASVYTQTAATARTVRLDIVWYSITGAVLSTTTGTGAADSVSWARLSTTGTAPASAVWAQLNVVITGALNTEIHYVGPAQFEAAAAVTDWESGRRINVYLDPLRANLVPNPSFEVDTAGWPTVINTTLTRQTTVFSSGVASGRLAATATGDMSAQTTGGTGGIPVSPNTYYTAQMKVRPGTTVRSFTVIIQWYNAAGTALSTSQTAFNEVAGTWTQGSVSAISPATAAFAAVKVYVTAPAAGEYHYVDAVMLEKTEFLRDYFDAAFTPTADYLWSGTAHASASNYYPRRDLKDYRLRTVLPSNVPAGLQFNTFYGLTAPASSV